MAPRKPTKTKLLLTQRALRDFVDIEAYSTEQWGKRTANRYLSDLEAGLERIRENPELLRSEEGFHASLRFYSVSRPRNSPRCDITSSSRAQWTNAGLTLSRNGERVMKRGMTSTSNTLRLGAFA